MNNPSPVRLGCLVSGRGRSVLNLQTCIENGSLPATIALVASTKPDVEAIRHARQRGLPCAEISDQPRKTLDDRLDDALHAAKVDLVVLAGYLRLFRVGHWVDRCLNIHPALLPRHGGAGMWGHHVHQSVLAAGDKESGCTVHWVDDRFDHGEIVLQRRCVVEDQDTPTTLAARVFEEELVALPEAIARVARWRNGLASRPSSGGTIPTSTAERSCNM